MDLETFTLFLGWCTLANVIIFILAISVVATKRDSLAAIHEKIFGLKKADLFKEYMHHLARYKIFILFFNLVPYLILRLEILG